MPIAVHVIHYQCNYDTGHVTHRSPLQSPPLTSHVTYGHGVTVGQLSPAPPPLAPSRRSVHCLFARAVTAGVTGQRGQTWAEERSKVKPLGD